MDVWNGARLLRILKCYYYYYGLKVIFSRGAFVFRYFSLFLFFGPQVDALEKCTHTYTFIRNKKYGWGVLNLSTVPQCVCLMLYLFI